MVFRLSAEPVLSADKPEDVIIAAAKLGQGRIVVFSHNSFGSRITCLDKEDENYRLYANVRKWVSNGKAVGDDVSTILNIEAKTKINSIDDLAKYNIVVYHTVASNYFDEAVLKEFVKNGGGLVYAITPWGWLQCNSNKTLKQAPYVGILHEAGVGFSCDLASCPEKVLLGRNKACEAHIFKSFCPENFCVDEALDKVNLVAQMRELPDDVCCELEGSIRSCWGRCRDDIEKKYDGKPVKTCNAKERGLLDMWQLGAEICAPKGIKAHGIKFFPGDYEVLPALSCASFQYESAREDFFHTGCYAPAAQSVLVEVTSVSPPGAKWKAIVGCHVDVLTEVAVRRWPKMSRSFDLVDKATLEINSCFGGLITLVSPNKSISSISLNISNFVSSPFFDLRDDDSVDNWTENRNLSGLWANISGKYVTITLPSTSVKCLDDPAPAVQFFDELLLAYHDLRGTDISEFRREWIVTDEQPSAGYMHAGHPIVTHLDVAQPSHPEFLLAGRHLRESGSWGIFHEIGHNMQQDAWTFDGTSEVTVNIFTLYAMETLCGKKAWIHDWLKPHVDNAPSKYLEKGADFCRWKQDAGLALVIYAQLANAFGWGCYKGVMRRYQNLKCSEKPRSDQDKIDSWFLIFSRECGYNLSAIAYFWGIPISEKGEKSLDSLGLEAAVCDDQVSSKALNRLAAVREKFPALKLFKK